MPDDSKTLAYVVDDDASVCKALEMLIISAGMEVLTFKSAEDFLEYEFRGRAGLFDFRHKNERTKWFRASATTF